MQLSELAQHYIDEHELGLAETTRSFVYFNVKSYRKFLGRDPVLADLNRDMFNRYVDWMVANRSLSTARTQRGGLLTLWRYAAEGGLAEAPRKLRKLRKPRLIVRTWNLDEVALLRNHCLSLPGVLSNGIPKSIYFGSMVVAAYETGLRRADMLSLEHEWIRPLKGEGHLTVLENKTGKEARRVLSKEAMQLIDACMAQGPQQRRLIWPLWTSLDAFSRMFARIIKHSGIRPGSFKYLRRTSCTACECARPGDGQLFLNHSDSRVTSESYLDRSQTHPMPIRAPMLFPMPPSLLAT